MKKFSDTIQSRSFALIALCFFWTASAYLTWFYHLAEYLPDSRVDLATEVVGYLFQAAGLIVYALIVRRSREDLLRVVFAAVCVCDLLCLTLAVCMENPAAVLVFGYGMNLLHGVIAGHYLYYLAKYTPRNIRGITFGMGYAAAVTGTWLISTMQNGTFLQSKASLPLYAAAMLAAVYLALREEKTSASATAEAPEKALFQGGQEAAQGQAGAIRSNERETALVRPGVIHQTARDAAGAGAEHSLLTYSGLLSAGGAVLLLSAVKNLGFAFPFSGISGSAGLEVSRMFYAGGLMLAGIVCDRSRKLSGALCIASLSVPFLSIMLQENAGEGIIVWVLNYFLFGFYAVFRVVLFADLSDRRHEALWLSGGGLAFGRIGDALGTLVCILLTDNTAVLITLTAVLFAVTVLVVLYLYQKLSSAGRTVPDEVITGTARPGWADGFDVKPAEAIPGAMAEGSSSAPVQSAERYEPRSPVDEKEQFARFGDKYMLSAREREVLQLLMEEMPNTGIAERLYVSESTVKFHVHNLLKKTNCANRLQLLALYRRECRESI